MNEQERRVLDLAVNPQSGKVHALVLGYVTHCGHSVDQKGWQRWGTNVVPLSDVTCDRCRRACERMPVEEPTSE